MGGCVSLDSAWYILPVLNHDHVKSDLTMNFAVRKLKTGQELKSVRPRFAIVPAHPSSYKANNVKKKHKNSASTEFLETLLAKNSHKNM